MPRPVHAVDLVLGKLARSRHISLSAITAKTPGNVEGFQSQTHCQTHSPSAVSTGSTCGIGTREEGITRIAESINRAHKETSFVMTVLENTAGGGSSIGWQFEHLRGIIDQVTDQSRVGVCLDTCHMFAAGYDLRTGVGFEQVMREFDKVVGLKYLRAMHVNDSKADLGSKRDRHENIGRGRIGLDCFKFLMNSPIFDGIPLVMETPVQTPGPKIDFPNSIAKQTVIFKQTVEEAGLCTDTRDIALLNSLVN